MTYEAAISGGTPATPTSSVRAIVSWLEKGQSAGSDKQRGRCCGTVPQESLTAPVLTAFPISTTYPATPSPRWPPKKASQVTSSSEVVKRSLLTTKQEGKAGSNAQMTPENTSATTPTDLSSPVWPSSLPVERTLSLSSMPPTERFDNSRSLSRVSPVLPTTSCQLGRVNAGECLQLRRPVLPVTVPASPISRITPPYTPRYTSAYAPVYTRTDQSLELRQGPVQSSLHWTQVVDSNSHKVPTRASDKWTCSARPTVGQNDKVGYDHGNAWDSSLETFVSFQSDGDSDPFMSTSPAARKKDEAGNTTKGVTNAIYRDPRTVEFFWSPVRQYLFITDEELYDP